MSIPTKLAFVDIETSGARVTSDRIIEIGIIRVEEGKEVARFESLINPNSHIPPFIEKFTGISPQDLLTAPTFADIKDTISEILDGCTFVAHNVRFDYGFLKNEFERAGVAFSLKHFCTVRLSRFLFPNERRHNLDALVERFGLQMTQRHRALADADATWQFYKRVSENTDAERFAKAVTTCLRRPSLPKGLVEADIQALPDGPGVYIFYGENGYPLYVGKSKNIRERVTSHFVGDYTSTREMHMSQQVTSIETVPTGGELSALLKEAMLVKQLQPLYNRKLRRQRNLVLLSKHTTPEGFETARIEVCDVLNLDEHETVLGVFKSQKQAKEWLKLVATEHQLCHKILDLESSRYACFGYQLGTCKGACCGDEAPETYNLRAYLGLSLKAIQRWPFDGPIIVQEASHKTDLTEGYIIDRWCLRGHFRQSTEGDPEITSTDLPFDVDTYKILRYFLTSVKSGVSIKPFPSEVGLLT